MAISTWEPSELDKWKQRAEQAEAELEAPWHIGRFIEVDGLVVGPHMVRSYRERVDALGAELERVNRIVVSQSQQLGNTRSQREHELIEALDSTQADADTQFKLRAQAEAELEALKARRCGGCKHWHGHNYCAEGIAEECDVPELPDHDFACNRWTPREAAE